MTTDYTNGFAEDLGAILGYSAARRLLAIYGGRTLYVPAEISADHPISRVLGPRAAAVFAREFGGETIDLPFDEEFDRLRRVRAVADLTSKGSSPADISRYIGGHSVRQINRYRREAESLGLLPLVLPGKSDCDSR